MVGKEQSANKKLEYPEFETSDRDNNVITLKKHNWEHILERRGTHWHNYWENIKETVEKHDYKKKTKGKKFLYVYIQEKNSQRLKFLQKYLLVFVNTQFDVITAYFSKTIDKFID